MNALSPLPFDRPADDADGVDGLICDDLGIESGGWCGARIANQVMGGQQIGPQVAGVVGGKDSAVVIAANAPVAFDLCGRGDHFFIAYAQTIR